MYRHQFFPFCGEGGVKSRGFFGGGGGIFQQENVRGGQEPHCTRLSVQEPVLVTAFGKENSLLK